MKRIILLHWFIGLLVSVSAQNTTNSEWATYLKGYEITDIADACSHLWLSNGKDLFKFDKNTKFDDYSDFDEFDMSPNYLITSIACSEDGLPCIGVTYVGILKMNADGKWVLLPPVNEQQLQNWGNVILLLSDNDLVWTAIFSLVVQQPILVKYQANDVTTFIFESPISSLAKDKYANIWIGKWDGGYFEEHDHYESLVKYDGENWTTFSSPLELGPPPMRIQEITFTEAGNIWMVVYFGLLDNGENKLIKFDYS